jgi:hypothetical protein
MAKGSRIFPSITARLIVGLTLGTTVLWCGAAAYSTYVSSKELNEAFDRALEEAAPRVSATVIVRPVVSSVLVNRRYRPWVAKPGSGVPLNGSSGASWARSTMRPFESRSW